MVDIEIYRNYEQVQRYWAELNASYKGGELAVDWEVHREIYNRFHGPAGRKLRIVVAADRGACVAVVPLVRAEDPQDAFGGWVMGEDAIIAREYFCPPARLHELLPALEPHHRTDLSCFYRPARPELFDLVPGCVVDLTGAAETYLATLKPKARYNLLRTLRLNADIEVVVGGSAATAEVGALREGYVAYWNARMQARGVVPLETPAEKIARDFTLFRRAAALGKLITVRLYLGGRLVAINYAVRREADRVDDYLCLRDLDPALAHRGLGVLAILKNMEVCRALGVRYCDMSDFPAPYKAALVGRGAPGAHYHCPRLPAGAPAGLAHATFVHGAATATSVAAEAH